MTGKTRKDLAGRMEQAASRSASMSAGSGTAPAAPAAAPRAKPVRLSLDLAPTAYRELQEFCAATAVALERPRVAGADVLRSLLAELGDNSDLVARVHTRLMASYPASSNA